MHPRGDLASSAKIVMKLPLPDVSWTPSVSVEPEGTQFSAVNAASSQVTAQLSAGSRYRFPLTPDRASFADCWSPANLTPSMTGIHSEPSSAKSARRVPNSLRQDDIALLLPIYEQGFASEVGRVRFVVAGIGIGVRVLVDSASHIPTKFERIKPAGLVDIAHALDVRKSLEAIVEALPEVPVAAEGDRRRNTAAGQGDAEWRAPGIGHLRGIECLPVPCDREAVERVNVCITLQAGLFGSGHPPGGAKGRRRAG